MEQDNVSVVSYIRRQGGPKRNLSAQVEALVKWALARRIKLVALWIPGTKMPADQWSRHLAREDQGDWSIKQAVFDSLCEKANFWPSVDLMASRLNFKVSRYYSFRPDPQALDFDALSADKDWAKEKGYAAPPSHLVGKVLAKIRRDGAKVLLVAPLWPHARWWNLPIWQSAMRKWHYVIPMNDSTVSAGQGRDPKRWPGAAAIAAVVDGRQSHTPPHSWTATRMSGTQF